jgi:hypothetical protein
MIGAAIREGATCDPDKREKEIDNVTNTKINITKNYELIKNCNKISHFTCRDGFKKSQNEQDLIISANKWRGDTILIEEEEVQKRSKKTEDSKTLDGLILRGSILHCDSSTKIQYRQQYRN